MKKKIYLLVIIMLQSVTVFYAVAQDIQVHGKVSDETRGPIPDATIVIKGKNKTVISAKDGTFSIAADANDVLTISSVGYIAQEININGKQNIEVVLVRSVGQLGEV